MFILLTKVDKDEEACNFIAFKFGKTLKTIINKEYLCDDVFLVNITVQKQVLNEGKKTIAANIFDRKYLCISISKILTLQQLFIRIFFELTK